MTIASGKITGAVTAGGGALNLPILEDAADQRTVTFKVSAAGGGRLITFTGTIDGDTISFVRDVAVQPGGNASWGTEGPRTFTATRTVRR